MVKSLSPQNSDDSNERYYLYVGNQVPSYPTDVDDCDFQDYSSDYHNMFYIVPNGDDTYPQEGDGKEGDIDEDDMKFQNELIFMDMDYKYCISCVFQDYHKDHDVIEEDEKDNIETLH